MILLLTCLFACIFFSPLLTNEQETQIDMKWIEEISKKPTSESIEWVREQLRSNLPTKSQELSHEVLEKLSKKRCYMSEQSLSENNPKLLVFMSFSIPKEVWQDLSHDLVRLKGAFVIQGLPDDSFVQLSKTLQQWMHEGFAASVQINPLLFEKYHICAVPAFVVIDEDHFDIVSGNISIPYALKLLSDSGGTQQAKDMWALLQEKKDE